MRIADVCDALIDGDSGAQRKDKKCNDEAPEIQLTTVAERVVRVRTPTGATQAIHNPGASDIVGKLIRLDAMNIPIEAPEFAGRGLAIQPAGWLSAAHLVLDGAPAEGKRGRFVVRSNSGREVTIRLKSNYIDPVPSVSIDDRPIVIARPLLWYEYVWSGLPILLSFSGGALGAICGIVALKKNAGIFRGDGSTAKKLLLTALVSAAAIISWYAIVQLIFGYALSPLPH